MSKGTENLLSSRGVKLTCASGMLSGINYADDSAWGLKELPADQKQIQNKRKNHAWVSEIGCQVSHGSHRWQTGARPGFRYQQRVGRDAFNQDEIPGAVMGHRLLRKGV
jgi:hypothetical protein